MDVTRQRGEFMLNTGETARLMRTGSPAKLQFGPGWVRLDPDDPSSKAHLERLREWRGVTFSNGGGI